MDGLFLSVASVSLLVPRCALRADEDEESAGVEPATIRRASSCSTCSDNGSVAAIGAVEVLIVAIGAVEVVGLKVVGLGVEV